MKKTLLAALVLSALSSAAFAGDWYVGANAGRVKNNNASNTLTQSNDNGYSVLAGYKYSSVLSSEVAYSNLGSANIGVNGLRANAVNVSGLAFVPVGMGVEAYGKLGVGQVRTQYNGVTYARSGLNYGLGAQYALNSSTTLRAGWDQYKVSNVGVNANDNVYSAGLTYTFGK